MSREERVIKTVNRFEGRGQIIRIGNNGYGSGTIVVRFKPLLASKDFSLTFTLSRPLPADFVPGVMVDIAGHVRGTSLMPQADGKWRSNQYFIVDEISTTKTVMERMLGVKGNYRESHFFTYAARGVFFSFYQNTKDWGRIVLKTAGGEEGDNYISANYFLKGRNPNPARFMRGDEVAVITTAGSITKMVNDVERRFENLYVEDIVSLSTGNGEDIPAMIGE